MAKQRRELPTRVGEVVQRYLARSGLASRIAQAQVIPDWPTLVGPQIAAVTTPDRVGPDGTLIVRVSTSAWLAELHLMAPDIIARLNAGRPTGRITAIRWYLAHDRS